MVTYDTTIKYRYVYVHYILCKLTFWERKKYTFKAKQNPDSSGSTKRFKEKHTAMIASFFTSPIHRLPILFADASRAWESFGTLYEPAWITLTFQFQFVVSARAQWCCHTNSKGIKQLFEPRISASKTWKSPANRELRRRRWQKGDRESADFKHVVFHINYCCGE